MTEDQICPLFAMVNMENPKRKKDKCAWWDPSLLQCAILNIDVIGHVLLEMYDRPQ